MPGNDTSQPPLIKRIERALVLLAYFLGLDGDMHLPMNEKIRGRASGISAVAPETKLIGSEILSLVFGHGFVFGKQLRQHQRRTFFRP